MHIAGYITNYFSDRFMDGEKVDLNSIKEIVNFELKNLPKPHTKLSILDEQIDRMYHALLQEHANVRILGIFRETQRKLQK